MKATLTLFKKYEFCCVGELYSIFLLNDISVYKNRLSKILVEYKDIFSFSSLEFYNRRCNNRDILDLVFDFEQLSKTSQTLHAQKSEGGARLESLQVEANYIEKNKLLPSEYKQKLNNEIPGILLIKSS